MGSNCEYCGTGLTAVNCINCGAGNKWQPQAKYKTILKEVKRKKYGNCSGTSCTTSLVQVPVGDLVVTLPDGSQCHIPSLNSNHA